ncbi:MAG TPA: histidinol-phosphate transaminase [Gaiellales bacterium]|nr:histidinol-phosphate transaminase [Gaiellales bacterium]
MHARPAIADLKPYEPGKPAAAVRRELGLDRIVKLASNEGPFGPFPAALEAIARQAPELNRYPELGHDLTERLAERHGVSPDQIALGNGADGLVGCLSTAYLDPGDEALMGWPSFVSYYLDAIKMGATPVTVPLRDGAYDLEEMAARVGERTRIAYVCNPNNPTGSMVGRSALAAFVDAVAEHVLVVVDEAYSEYITDPDYPDTIAEHVGRRPNVAALRTFSKIYGLAGLRVGYLVGPAEVVREVMKVRNAFDVSELAHVAAVASLDDAAELVRRRDLNERGRIDLEAAFAELGMQPFPACANFLAVDVGDGRALASALLRDGVIVRPLEPFGAPECIRVTVGTPEENAIFTDVLGRALQPQ